MSSSGSYDSVIVGSGANGLAAAITLARAGKSVCVLEAGDIPGGCLKSDEATWPGFILDTCSAIFPMAVDTPFFSSLPPGRFPVEWITPPAALAHPFDDGSCLLVSRSLESARESLKEDGPVYGRYVRPFAGHWRALAGDVLKPTLHVPAHPYLFACFGIRGMWPVSLSARCLFKTDKARALFAGLGAHSIMPLEHPLTSAFALFMCASAHATGWPIPRGGAGSIAGALAAHLTSLGGEILTSHAVHSWNDLPPGSGVFFDLTPRQILEIAQERIPQRTRIRLSRYRYGPGVFKVDWALDGPIPWKAADCLQAATVHLGGSYEEIAQSEREVWQGIHPHKPFVLCAQPSLFDRSRAPDGKHVAWAYCHVPNGSAFDMTERIEDQIERFAPGFRKRLLRRRTLCPGALEQLNPNLIGGDIAGGANIIPQMILRPVPLPKAYQLDTNIFICSSSSPPGGGVHGMCGYNAALAALKKMRKST